MSSQRKVDPINLLRESFIENKPIVYHNGALTFADKTTLKLDTPTAWQPPDKTKRYSLGDLWVFLSVKRDNKPNPEYYQRISEFRPVFPVQLISFQHQGLLIRGNRKILFWPDRLLGVH